MSNFFFGEFASLMRTKIEVRSYRHGFGPASHNHYWKINFDFCNETSELDIKYSPTGYTESHFCYFACVNDFGDLVVVGSDYA